MLRFLIFDGERPAGEFSLRHACLIGPEGVPAAGEVRFHDGLIECAKTNSEAAGLALQIPLDERARAALGSDGEGLPTLGVLTLQTCLLPERDAPYLLSLELARHRLMVFLNKLEEWQLFDHPDAKDVLSTFEQARLAFTEALVAQHDETDQPETHGYSAQADRLAMRSLWLGVEAGDQLALLAARCEFVARCDGSQYDAVLAEVSEGPPVRGKHPPVIASSSRIGVTLPDRPLVGCAISPSTPPTTAQTLAHESCDFVTMPMRWLEMEPSEGRYAFQQTDRWIEWAVRKAKKPVFAGPLIDFRPSCVPEWLYIWENDYETLRELVYEHMKNLVTRYRRTIQRWTVVSGLHTNTNFQLSFDQMMDLTRICVMVVRKLQPAAKVLIEIVQPWGEYYTHNRRSMPPILYAEMCAQAGIVVDAFALRVQMGQPEPGQSTRDLMAFSAMLDRYAMLDKPIAISGMGVPSESRPGADAPELADRFPGSYRRPWSQEAQADWLSNAMSIAAAKPFVQSVCWHEIADLPVAAEMHSGGLISGSDTPKLAADRLRAVRASVAAATLPDALRDLRALGGAPR
jgi:hypothetical protein